MIKSKPEFKRVRPLLGTFFEISVCTALDMDRVFAEITGAYREAERSRRFSTFMILSRVEPNEPRPSRGAFS